MLRLEDNWLKCILFLVLHLAEPLCSQESTVLPLPNSTVNMTGQNDVNPPKVFPQTELNGTKIIVSNMIQNATSLTKVIQNTTNIDLAKVLNNFTANDTVDSNQNSTNIASSAVELTNVNLTATDVPTVENKTDLITDVKTEMDSTILVNDTSVAKTTINSSKIDTEVSDLLKAPYNLTAQIPDTPPKIIFDSTNPVNSDTELIEDGENTEDVLRNSTLNEEKRIRPGVPLLQGQLAAILAGVFVVISVTAYVGLLTWRRYLEQRYGNRQMLINEEEFNDDLKHFSL